jgi:hypothetical protein
LFKNAHSASTVTRAGKTAVEANRVFNLTKESSQAITKISAATKNTGLFVQNGVTKRGAALNRGAENVNAAAALRNKLSQLEGAQQSSVNIRTLSDGRIRCYDLERAASTSGPTRGRSYVTEFNPRTGQVRTWMECYDQAGKVNRVHPKQINGQELISSHYPPTAKELGL